MHPEGIERVLYAGMVLGLASLLVVLGQRCDRLGARLAQLESRSLAEAKPRTESTVTLRYDTPVYHEWRDPKTGEVFGSYKQTLYEYTHGAEAEARQDEAISNLYLLVNGFVTDPTMRGHLMRHDVTRKQLDALASTFSPNRLSGMP